MALSMIHNCLDSFAALFGEKLSVTRVKSWLEHPVSGASLGVFRLGFGAVNIYQTFEFVSHRDDLYVGENVHWNFPYPNFEWIQPLAEPGTSILFGLSAFTAALLMLGIMSRLSAFIHGLFFTYLWMMEATYWNNHYYLSSLFAFLLALMPCGCRYSVDAWLAWRRTPASSPFLGMIPFWPIFLLRAQLFIVYTYAAVVKMNPDWMMGEPIRGAFQARAIGLPLASRLTPAQSDAIYGVLGSELVIFVFIWGGLLFDLFIGTMLCFRRTQVLALALVAGFHFMNTWTFQIGAFPVMAMASTLIFLDPDWPERLLRWIRRPTFSLPEPMWMLVGMIALPIVGALLGWKIPKSQETTANPPPKPISPALLATLSIYLLVQILLPLRHWTIPGNVHWTLEGSRFSWQVMARAHQGHVTYRVRDPSWEEMDPPTDIPWPSLDGKVPPIIYDEIDASRIRPSDLPFLFVTEEPWLGERAFTRLDETVKGAKESNAQTIARRWQENHGRLPNLVPTRPLVDLLDDFVKQLRMSRQNSPEILRRLDRLITSLRELARLNADSPLFFEKAINVQSQINPLRTACRDHAILNDLTLRLIQSHPFDLQTGRGISSLQVIDPVARAKGGSIDWSSWKQKPPVFIDFVAFHADARRLLPDWLPAFDHEKRPVAFWNAERDLNPFVYMQHSVHPLMISQYARGRVAKGWEERTGRSPKVFVDARSKLNQHPMQPLIDTEVDMARAPMSVWTHNPWILPMKYRQLVEHDAKGIPRLRLVEVP